MAWHPRVVTLSLAPAATEDRPVGARLWCRSLSGQRRKQLPAPDAGTRFARSRGAPVVAAGDDDRLAVPLAHRHRVHRAVVVAGERLRRLAHVGGD